MSRRLARISLALALLVAGNALALGLGEIRQQSALNEPFRAEIELLSATPEELDNLDVMLASADTFERYGLDRPFYLQGLEFNIVRGPNPVVQIRSRSPITEPFLTMLVEAVWSRGRLLREYTVLLDPPTFAPPQPAPAPAVAAPERTRPADEARIERPPATTRPAPSEPAPEPAARPRPAQSQAAVSDEPFDTGPGGDYTVSRGETLWGIATRVRPDSRLSMNQVMLAIFEANPEAFDGNVNRLRAGASLRVPSADEIFRIDRGDAQSEVLRQHAAWGGTPAPRPAETPRPSLTLVPPDEEPAAIGTGVDTEAAEEPMTREQEILERIAEIEAGDVPSERSLIQIRDNELAALRQELARIRGEVYEPPVADTQAADDPFVEEDEVSPFPEMDEIMAEDAADDAADDAAADEEADDAGTAVPTTIVSDPRRAEPSIVDRILGALTDYWTIIAGALVVAGGILFWFVRRGRGEDEEPAWRGLDQEDDLDATMTGTESLRAPSRDDESIVVVEQSGRRQGYEPTVETPAVRGGERRKGKGDTGEFAALEDTFSSETAVNLDQSDPIAEADFHMAYGLYDQAADLINGALEAEPERVDYLTKLCEIYFVWGNRDAFVDAAERLKAAVGDEDSADWDKIVIMGQQIAGDHEMFAGAGVAGATKAVDLSFEAETGSTGALDMEFGDEGGDGDVIDLGAGDQKGDEEGLDFLFDEDSDDTAITRESPTIERSASDSTVEMPDRDRTVETPTIEQPFEFGDESLEATGKRRKASPDETAEIDLDDLGLDLDGLEDTELASLDDLGSGDDEDALSDTGISESLGDRAEATGKNPEVDPTATGVQRALSDDSEDLDDFFELESSRTRSGLRLARDETGRSPALDLEDDSERESDVDFDESLLDATGHTQVLPEDFTVESTGINKTLARDMKRPPADDGTQLSDDDATLLARSLDDDSDFDFAKTEALPTDVFTGDSDLEETGEMPAVASTDLDLDLDDLTAALRTSGMGDTVDQPRDDRTVEQPRPRRMRDDDTARVPTMELGPEDLSEELNDARTMTEVGTKLDLARAYVDMGDPGGARSILEEVLDEGDDSQRQQAQKLLDSLPT